MYCEVTLRPKDNGSWAVLNTAGNQPGVPMIQSNKGKDLALSTLMQAMEEKDWEYHSQYQGAAIIEYDNDVGEGEPPRILEWFYPVTIVFKKTEDDPDI